MDSILLEWTNYYCATKSSFAGLYEDDSLTDVTLACEGNQSIRAHKVILHACSDFFRDILTANPSPHPLIYLQGVDIKHLELVKKFMYLGKARVDREHAETFMEVSKYLLNTDDRYNVADGNSDDKLPIPCQKENNTEKSKPMLHGKYTL